MRSAMFVVVALAVMAVCVRAGDSVDLGERDTAEGHKKWDKVLGKKPTLVLFYSPGCAHSRGFMPEFEAAAAESDSGVTFAKVDIWRWDQLKDKYDVRRVPDIRFCSVGRDDDCTSYPEHAPNTKSGVLEYLSGRGARFLQADADSDSQTRALSDAELAAIAATKGTCEVPAHGHDAEAEEMLGEDEDTASDEAVATDETFSEDEDMSADAFVELKDEDEDEVEAEDELEGEEEDVAVEDEAEADA